MSATFNYPGISKTGSFVNIFTVKIRKLSYYAKIIIARR